jgi:MinD superfamily P-loop ATPase
MQIAIASGKGGTGKTTISVALAQASDTPACLLDCDVEEPNSAFFTKPEDEISRDVSVLVPLIDVDACTACGVCSDFCEFNAIVTAGESAIVFTELCHSCGGCLRICPQNAIMEKASPIGEITSGQSGQVQTIEGRLNIACAMAPPLIRSVKKASPDDSLVWIDSPPGTSCPMITATLGSDFVILVTEPTPFGLNDLILAVKTVQKIGLPLGVIINRSDAGDDRVVRYCEEENIRILLQVPESRSIAEAYSRGIGLLDAEPGLKPEFIRIIQLIKSEFSK